MFCKLFAVAMVVGGMRDEVVVERPSKLRKKIVAFKEVGALKA